MIKRYSVREIEKIFSDDNKYKIWLKIELLALKYHALQGFLTAEEYAELESDLVAIPNQIRRREKITNHDVAAFVASISESTTLKTKKWIHYGLTSSDLVDTGNSVMIQSANNILMGHARKLLLRLKRISMAHKYSYGANRITGFKIDGAYSFGCRIAQYYSDIKEALDALEEYRKYVECASISGSMGICSHINPKMQDFIAQELNIYSADCSTQVLSRDRYYVFFQFMNRITQSINGMCTELRLLARSEIGEISENFQATQIGSSSMPHKRNPITLENICGLCRLFNAYCSAASKNISIWLERDISHSSVDRILLLDGFTLITHLVKKMTTVMGKLQINSNAMKKNIEDNFYLVYKKYLCREIYKKTKDKKTWQEIEKYLDQIHEESISNKVKFIELFNSKKESEDMKTPNLFNLHHHLSFIEPIYKQIFKEDDKMNWFDTIFYRKEEIEKAINTIASKLNEKYSKSKKSIRLIAIRDESIIFLSNLLLKLNFSVELSTTNSKNAMEEMEFHFLNGQQVIILRCLETGDGSTKKIKDKVDATEPESVYIVSLFIGLDNSMNEIIDLYGLILPTTKNIGGFGIDNGKGKYGNINAVGRLKADLINAI